MTRTFVIAEVGSTHDGLWRRALDLIRDAHRAGADAVKFQFWSDAAGLAIARGASELTGTYARHQLPVGWLPRLAGACHEEGIEFMCTAYLRDDLRTLDPYVTRFKIASFESTDRDFVLAHFPLHKPVIVSSGAMTDPELRELLVQWRDRRPAFMAVLHCVSGYPTPVSEANLRVIREYGLDGWSDHTGSTVTGALAVAMGAWIVEVHLRHPETPPDNPDYPHALTPAQLREYIDNIRCAEQALGDGQKRIMPAEVPNVAYRTARA